MSSPIHKYLFSPPPSPPVRPSDAKHRPPPLQLSSVKILLNDQLSPRLPLPHDELFSELKPRSPRTPQNRNFTMDSTYHPSSYPSRNRTPRSGNTWTKADDDMDGDNHDLEMGNITGLYSNQTTPRVVVHEPISTPRRVSSKTMTTIIQAPPLLPTNVPTVSSSSTYTIHLTLPKPLLRLTFLASLVVASILLLIYVPSARLPSLRDATVSRRLALAEDGRAFMDVIKPVNSWMEGKDRDYVPPMVKSNKMLKRGFTPVSQEVEVEPVVEAAEVEERVVVAPNPRASRPTPSPRPIPESHELLALQSYLLGSAYNTLPETLDASKPLDANIVLGFNGDLANKLEEIEQEWRDEVVIWYGADGKSHPPHALLSLLEKIHGPTKTPTLIPCHGRTDLPALTTLFDRFNLPITQHPLIMIGNKPLIANEDVQGDSEALKNMMREIGWLKVEGKEGKGGWKPKFAKVGKKEVSEVEKALKEVKR